METGLILLILGFIVVAYLIFKFIKKVVVAVVSIVLLFIVLVGAIVGLVVLDMNQLMDNQNYDIQVVYATGDDYHLGVEIPVENKEVQIDRVVGVENSELSGLDVEDIQDDENRFVVVVTDDTFEKLLTKDVYNLSEIQGIDVSKLDGIDLTLTKDEVVTIVNSEDGVSTLVDIIFTKNKIDGVARDMLEGPVKDEIRKNLEETGLNFREAMFVYVIGDSLSSNEGVVTLLSDFKSQELEVYPDRLSFKVLRMLPIDMLSEQIDTNVSTEE